jgi:hypothetical protein
MRPRYSFAFAWVLAWTAVSSFGAAPLTSGADFLLMTTGARPDGMGQAFSAVADDINTLSFNPAGLGNIRMPEIGYGHESFFSGIGYDFLGAAIPSGDLGVFGFGYLGMGTAPFNSTANPSAPLVSVMDQAYIGAWGRSFYNLHVGLAVKYITERVDTVQGTGFAADAGFRFRINPEWTVAAAVLNAGPGIQFASLEPLPLEVNGGVAWTAYEDPVHTLHLAADSSTDLASQVQRYSVGAEYWYKNLLALRAGYLANSDDEGFSMGLGFQFQFFQLDYAYEPYNNLGSVHRFSGILRWDGPWVAGGEPNAPNFVAARQTPQGLEIRWEKPRGPVESYEVLIQPMDGRDAVLSPPVGNPVYLYQNPVPDTLYRISVRSIGYGGVRSFPSKETYVLTGEQGAAQNREPVGETPRGNPTVSKGLEVKVDSIGLHLSWNPPPGNAYQGYNLYRKSPSGTVEKVTGEPKQSATLWVMDTSGLRGWTWIVTGVLGEGREKALGTCLWYPTPYELETLAESPTLRLNASPQVNRRVFLDWDGDRQAAGYSLLFSRVDDGVYELYKDTGKSGTTLMLDVLGKRKVYYFVIAPRDSSGRWLKRTKETRVELFTSTPPGE